MRFVARCAIYFPVMGNLSRFPPLCRKARDRKLAGKTNGFRLTNLLSVDGDDELGFFQGRFTRSGQSLFRVTVFRKYRSRHDGHPAGTTESCGFRDWHLDSVVPIETLLCGIGSNACLCLVSLYRQRFAGIPFSDSFIHGGEKSIHLF